MKHTKTLIAIVLLSALFCSCTAHRESAFIQTADSLLWTNPDSCIQYISNNRYSAKEEKRVQLIYEHAIFKSGSNISNDTIFQELLTYFTTTHDFRSAGETMYLQGAQHVQNGNYFEATVALKEAEYYYNQAYNIKPILKGMLYFYLGATSERSRLFDTATEYYQLAIPFLKSSQKALYIAAAYHNLSKTTFDRDRSIQFIDSALYYASQLNNSSYPKEIEVTKHLILKEEGQNKKETFISNLKYLCDSCQIYSYAGILADEYLKAGMLSESAHYIAKLANDTIYSSWSKENHYVLSAELLKKQGEIEEAYLLLKDILEQQTTSIESSAYSSTYIISQKYDVAKEQELRLQEQVKKQRAYFWIAVVLLVCICIGGYTYYINKKRKLELQLSNEQKKRLEEELHTNRAVLRARIKERIEVVKELNAWSSHHHDKMPDILGTLSPKQAASDPQNWQEFYTEFNLCYDNLLAKLKEQYPALTESDMQYIAITYLGFNGTDMGFLLNITKRTIWNRKNHVKQHMSMSEDLDLDNWILHELHK